MDVDVCIGTYGGDEWIELATDRAIPSVPPGHRVIHHHGETLAIARNAAAAEGSAEWICFLDADDQLSPDYLEQMATGSADLRGPAVKYAPAHPSKRVPTVWPMRDLYEANFLAIGTLVRRSVFEAAGGFGEEPVYEDYALWCRCAKAGASIELIPTAVYLAWIRRQSRNRGPDMKFKNEWHFRIRDAVWPERSKRT